MPNKTQIDKYHYLILGLGLFLAISFLGNIYLYQKLKQTYLDLYKVKLNPLGINRYSQQEKPYITKKSRVVFYGDSRAYQWKYQEKDNDFQFINRGINGQTSTQVLWRFDAHIAQLKPKVIVLQMGINDLVILSTPSKTRKDIVQNCKNNIAQIIERANSIDSDIIITTIFPLGKGQIPFELRPFWSSVNEMERSINEVNQYIRSLRDDTTSAYSDRVFVLDAYSLLHREDQDKLKYYQDLLHINQEGYKLLNQELKSILNDIRT